MKKYDNLKELNINSTLYKTRLGRKFENRKPFQPKDPYIITSFIPATILDIFVKEGDTVRKGDVLLILDAMKMQNRLKSPVEGIINRIMVSSGQRVSKGSLLVELVKPA